jgi:hypothetical protein
MEPSGTTQGRHLDQPLIQDSNDSRVGERRQPTSGEGEVSSVPNRPAHGRTPCTPPPAAQLFEIIVLDTTGEDGHAHWHTIGWSLDRRDADIIAESYVTRSICPYNAARIRHKGSLLVEHRRIARGPYQGEQVYTLRQ